MAEVVPELPSRRPTPRSPLVLQLIREYFTRRRVKGMFGNYLSPEEVARIVDTSKASTLGADEIEITPFFVSIHSYVSYAEGISLPHLRDTMNAYFEVATNAITEQQGTLDKYIGDAVVAMFGAPVGQPDHALQGCLAALQCQAGMAALRERFQREPDRWPAAARRLRVRIGLHTGVALVGNMGTATRFNFTMMGDTVNLAARLESAARTYGVWTLCSETTQLACERTAPGRILFRPLGKIVVAGRAQPVAIFEPIALRENASNHQGQCVTLFTAGLNSLHKQNWDDAIALFTESAQLEADQAGDSPEPHTNPSLIFLRRAQAAKASPDTTPDST